MPLTI